MKEVKFIAFGAGQCSSVLPFLLDDFDLIIFADTGLELPLTYEWIKIIEKAFPDKFVRVDTADKFVKCHPPLCTKEAKILPIRRYLRSLGVTKAIKYLGITAEEGNRMSESDVKWEQIKRPLVAWGWTRKTCQQFLLKNFGFVPPQSGCILCRSFDRQHLLDGIKLKNKSIYKYLEAFR